MHVSLIIQLILSHFPILAKLLNLISNSCEILLTLFGELGICRVGLSDLVCAQIKHWDFYVYHLYDRYQNLYWPDSNLRRFLLHSHFLNQLLTVFFNKTKGVSRLLLLGGFVILSFHEKKGLLNLRILLEGLMILLVMSSLAFFILQEIHQKIILACFKLIYIHLFCFGLFL